MEVFIGCPKCGTYPKEDGSCLCGPHELARFIDEDDPQDRAPMTEAIDTIADLRRQLEEAKAYNAEWIERCRRFRKQDADEYERQLETAKLEAQYAMEAVANLHKEVAELKAEIERLREAFKNYAKNEYRNHDNISREEITTDYTSAALRLEGERKVRREGGGRNDG